MIPLIVIKAGPLRRHSVRVLLHSLKELDHIDEFYESRGLFYSYFSIRKADDYAHNFIEEISNIKMRDLE